MKWRVFVALDLPDAVRQALPSPGEGWRAVPSSSLHVTLAFLGWVEASAVGAVCEAVNGALTEVGEMSVGGVVLLPPRRPRVMAVRLVEGVPTASALQAAVSSALAAADVYEPEKRAWLPHVTIGRARGAVRRDAPVPSMPALSFVPPSVSVYRSLLSPSGAKYEPIARFALP